MQRVTRRLFNSRYFTISLLLHVLFLFAVGSNEVYRRYVDPPDFSAEEGAGFILPAEVSSVPRRTLPLDSQRGWAVSPLAHLPAVPGVSAVITMAPAPTAFTIPAIVPPANIRPGDDMLGKADAEESSLNQPAFGGISREIAQGISGFIGGWAKDGGRGPGVHAVRSREFGFTAYLAKYSGGDWDATVRMRDGKITGGSLPNLLYFLNSQSGGKIKAEMQAQPLDLASDEIFARKPTFIFFCGHRDFKLTSREVENLRQYIQLGGCIWGDSSLPGRRSRFDIAFRREMRRVIPDKDKEFQILPADHELFSRDPARAFFTDVPGIPPGLNFYQEPVYALEVYGEIAVLYTANDYGDMWQFGITENGQIDTRRDESSRYITLNAAMFARRDLYFRNINGPALLGCYKFGANIVVHLLTRWEDRIRSLPSGL